MKWKDYDELVEMTFKYHKLFCMMNISEDGTISASDYNETRNGLEKRKQDIDDILTIDMQEFVKYFMKYINSFSGEEYIVEKLDLGTEALYVARPKKSEEIADSDDLDREDVYVLGMNDKKVLSHTKLQVHGLEIPTVAVSNPRFSYIYERPERERYEKYYKFTTLMQKLEENAVNNYKKKLSTKR